MVKADCKKCKYRTYLGNISQSQNLVCNYYFVTGKRATRDGNSCNRYEVGRPVKKKAAPKLYPNLEIMEPVNETAKKIFERKPYS